MLSVDLYQFNFSPKYSFRNAIRVSSCSNSDQVRSFIGPDLGPSCFLRLSADDQSRHYYVNRQRVNASRISVYTNICISTYRTCHIHQPVFISTNLNGIHDLVTIWIFLMLFSALCFSHHCHFNQESFFEK